MSGHFHDFGKELGVTDPKSLKDIYKTHLENCICTELNALANINSVLQCMALGLGLLYLGLQDAWDTTIETFKAIEHPISKIVQIVVEYSHNNNNLAVALSAIFVMELLAGCSKEPNCLFIVHIAQELVHIDKGTLFFSNGSIMSQPANAGFLPTLMASTDAKHCKCPQFSSSTNTTGMYLRFLITVNGELNNSTIAVHIGQALNVVGQAGKPRTISGFQMHQMPMWLALTKQAEIVTDRATPPASILQGPCILSLQHNV
ncbi:hypothetical protein B0H14DRAFT_2612169 [Mycena olivaceomarginata]|nr:hypothetical protein B0H14DRAFT_2612169 [Mycena olivaceomarginata]